jgi:hypothetical protein
MDEKWKAGCRHIASLLKCFQRMVHLQKATEHVDMSRMLDLDQNHPENYFNDKNTIMQWKRWFPWHLDLSTLNHADSKFEYRPAIEKNLCHNCHNRKGGARNARKRISEWFLCVVCYMFRANILPRIVHTMVWYRHCIPVVRVFVSVTALLCVGYQAKHCLQCTLKGGVSNQHVMELCSGNVATNFALWSEQ